MRATVLSIHQVRHEAEPAGDKNMAGLLKCKVKKSIGCEICGCRLNRTKTFSITASGDNDADRQKLKEKAKSWLPSDKQKHCGVCWSIIN